MKLKDFFINCLNRRSFQFLGLVGIIILSLPILIALFYHGTTDYLIFVLMPMILPTCGRITILSIILIYFKLLIREHSNPEYRIKNHFLTRNPVYAIFSFGFYIFAILSISFLLFEINNINLDFYKEVFKYPIYFYPFLIYTLIHCFIIFII